MANSTSQQLDALYARIPKVNCKRLCQESCGPLGMSAFEAKVLAQLTFKKKPSVDLRTMTCCYLKDGACSVYARRPTVCRLWGTIQDVPHMRCPHGCVPDRWLTNQEAGEILRAVSDLSHGEFVVSEIEM